MIYNRKLFVYVAVHCRKYARLWTGHAGGQYRNTGNQLAMSRPGDLLVYNGSCHKDVKMFDILTNVRGRTGGTVCPCVRPALQTADVPTDTQLCTSTSLSLRR